MQPRGDFPQAPPVFAGKHGALLFKIHGSLVLGQFASGDFSGKGGVGEPLLGFEFLPQGGVERVAHAVADEFDVLSVFAVHVALAEHTPIALLKFCRSPWHIEVVRGDHAALHIHACPQALGAANNDAHLAFVHHIKERLLFLVGIPCGIGDDGDLARRDALGDEFLPDVLVEVKGRAGRFCRVDLQIQRGAGDSLEKRCAHTVERIGKNHLGAVVWLGVAVKFHKAFHHAVHLALRLVFGLGIDEANVDGRSAAGHKCLHGHGCEAGIFRQCLSREVGKILQDLAYVGHPRGNALCAGYCYKLGLAALDAWSILYHKIVTKFDIGGLAQKRVPLRQVHKLGKSIHIFKLAGGPHFRLGGHLGKFAHKLVEEFDIPFLEHIGRDQAGHVPDFPQRICDGGSSHAEDIFPAHALLDLPGAHEEVVGALAGRPVDALGLQLCGERHFFEFVDLVHDEGVHAELLEIEESGIGAALAGLLDEGFRSLHLFDQRFYGWRFFAVFPCFANRLVAFIA